MPVLKRLTSGAISLCFLLVAGSCGVYTFNPRGESSIQSVSIEQLENKTSEYGLADRLTNVIIDAFIDDGTIKVVPATSAEASLICVLNRYERVVDKFDENDQVDIYKIVMDFEITLRDPEDDSDIWKQTMTQEGTYDADEETEEDGQNRAAERLVEAVINKTTKSW